MGQEDVLALPAVVKTQEERFTGPTMPANETLEDIQPSDFTCKPGGAAPEYKNLEEDGE